MPADVIRIGALTVNQLFPNTAGSVLGDCSALTNLTMTVAAITPNLLEIHDITQPLDPSITYKVAVATWGYDIANGGYTFNKTSPFLPSSGQTVTAGQALHVSIPNANLPTGVANATGIAMFLQQGSANPQLAKVSVVDAARDFEDVIGFLPHPAAPTFLASDLTGGNSTSLIGSASPYPNTALPLGPTINGVALDMTVTDITVPLDNSPPFKVRLSSQPSLSFEVADNSTLNYVRSNAGVFAQYSPGSSQYVATGSMGIATASATLRGNTAVSFTAPVDNQGAAETYLMFGALENQSGTHMLWGQRQVPTIQFKLETGIQDKLLRNVHSMSSRRFSTLGYGS